ncbi:MAG: hydrogenase expression/formation protein HypE, partial [Sediminibacterium sp.]|nr:hydrogenase expression/formation protein HypE [Sediminibacterium sp.]
TSINLGHGSGGILTHKLLNRGVFDVLKNDLLNQKHDGAVFDLQGKVAFSTDSYVVNPIFFPGGNIGELAINGTVNDLAMCGALAKYLSLSFIIEEGLAMETFWQILNSIKECCLKANVHIVTGDTKVVEKGKGDKIFINTSGIGIVHPDAIIQLSRIQNNDVIVVNGNIAEHGIAIMSIRSGLEFETNIVSDTTNLNFTIQNVLNQFGSDIHFLRDATRGGLASVLNEIAKDGNVGVEIKQMDIPVNEQVYGACEMLGLDPLYVANEGVFIAVVKKEIAFDVVKCLQQDEKCKNATTIGCITSHHKGQVILQSNIGGKRVVNMLPGEQLPRIC